MRFRLCECVRVCAHVHGTQSLHTCIITVFMTREKKKKKKRRSRNVTCPWLRDAVRLTGAHLEINTCLSAELGPSTFH